MSGDDATRSKRTLTPTQFFLRGLAISLPTILTLIILIWIGNGFRVYLIHPTTAAVKWTFAQFVERSVPILDRQGEPRLVPLTGGPALDFRDRDYLVTPELRNEFRAWQQQRREPDADAGEEAEAAGLANIGLANRNARDWVEERIGEVYVPFGDEAVPYTDYVLLAKMTHPLDMPTTATQFYMDFAAERYFKSAYLLSAFAVVLVIIALYFLGRFVNVRLGGWFVHKFETAVLGRLPLIRNVYGSAKQVTDFLFSESQVEYRRVVAIEYPRRGIWSLGLVTGESMLDITAALGEPCLSVLIPSSPMPVTGYTMNVPRSQVLDLNISVDQAMQFCISCGVLVPPSQKVTPELLQQRLSQRLADELRNNATLRRREAILSEGLPPAAAPGTAERDPPIDEAGRE